MKVLINDLLLYSRINNNKDQFTITDLNKLMLYITKMLKESIDKSHAVITINPLPIIIANKTLINELFVNLLTNAIKYCGKKKPEIEVGYKEELNNYTFYVKDNGIGNSAEYFDKIFVIFQRLHGKSKYPGTGMAWHYAKK